MKNRLLTFAALALSAVLATANLSAQAVEKAKDKTAAAAKTAGQTVEKAAETTKDATVKAAKKVQKGAPTQNASAQEIADAKAKGMVWVNTDTGVYHKTGQYYGATKEGKFMTEAEAQKAGYHAAKAGGKHKDK